MILKIKHFVVFATIGFCFSCHEAPSPTKIEGEKILVDTSFSASDSIQNFIAPYRIRLNEVLDSTLAFAPRTISKTDGPYNTTAGNLMADIVMSEANPIFKARTGKEIDFVLLNHGGIRSLISKGKVSARTAYEVMPFDNLIVVVELNGTSVLKLVHFLRDSGRAHPVSGIQIVLSKDNSIKSILVQDEPLDENRNYYVATSDYLDTGGDNMGFFAAATKTTNTDYLIRNAMVDYFKKTDTIAPVIDNRFYKEAK